MEEHKHNGITAVSVANDDDRHRPVVVGGRDDGPTLIGAFNRFTTRLGSSDSTEPLVHRFKNLVADLAQEIPEASRNSAKEIVEWTKGGSALRALLVISVGTISLVALTGFVIFMVFFVALTFNAAVVALLISLAAAGGFLAIFFTSLAAIYVGAVAVAFFMISFATIAIIVAVAIAMGWIGFLWIVWVFARQSLNLAARSLRMTSSTLTKHSASWQLNNAPKKEE